VGLRYNPPPGWPPASPGSEPQPGWQPDPSWPPPPPGWQLWLSDDGSQQPWTASPSASAQQTWAAPSAGWTGQPGWGQQPYGAAPPGYGMPAGQRSLSRQAVVAFIAGLLSVIIVAVPFGILALVRIRSTGQRGKGLAIAGLALSGFWAVVGIAVVGLLVASSTNGPAARSSALSGSSAAARPHRTGSTSVFALLPGDCFDNPADQHSIASVASLPCTRAHDAQVFANFKLTGGDQDYPGTTTVQHRAAAGCNARFRPAVERSRITSSMSVRFIYPQQLAWTLGHRTVSCLIVDSSRDLTASLVKSPGG
jgi:hypothetical protein